MSETSNQNLERKLFLEKRLALLEKQLAHLEKLDEEASQAALERKMQEIKMEVDEENRLYGKKSKEQHLENVEAILAQMREVASQANLEKKVQEVKVEADGIDFPAPTPEEFGITQDEFKIYRNQFGFGYIKILVIFVLIIVPCILILRESINGVYALVLLVCSVIIAIGFKYLFEHLDRKLVKKNNEKIFQYQNALKIYHAIQKQNSA